MTRAEKLKAIRRGLDEARSWLSSAEEAIDRGDMSAATVSSGFASDMAGNASQSLRSLSREDHERAAAKDRAPRRRATNGAGYRRKTDG